MKIWALSLVGILIHLSLVQSQKISRPILGLGCPVICPAVIKPICGSDGVTYENDCALAIRNCKNPGPEVTKVYEGKCTQSQPTSKQVCPTICTADYRPVCGSDGKTYSNMCGLRAKNCQDKTSVTVVAEGECEDETCPSICTADYRPVCGSDGKTYSNMCGLTVKNCQDKTSVTVVAEGECEDKEQKCPDACGFILSPVCGTDGITYSNLCQLEVDNCKNNRKVFSAYPGPCRDTTPSTCTSQSAWKVRCNWCRCSFGQASCTKRRCLPNDKSVEECIPGSQWKINCNWCTCLQDGKQSCTEKACAGSF